MTPRLFLPLLAALALAACGHAPAPKTDLDRLDAQITAGADAPAADPALRSALHDRIMVDPALVEQANDHAVRPPPMPVSAPVPPDDIAPADQPTEHDAVRAAPAATADCPECIAARRALTLGALAGGSAGGACAQSIAYSATWANRLPAAVPLYPDAAVREAAGADRPGCALRVVSFRSSASVGHLLDWYYTKASAAGFRAAHHLDGAEHALAGTRAGGAFLLLVRPRGSGSEADLMVDAR